MIVAPEQLALDVHRDRGLPGGRQTGEPQHQAAMRVAVGALRGADQMRGGEDVGALRLQLLGVGRRDRPTCARYIHGSRDYRNTSTDLSRVGHRPRCGVWSVIAGSLIYAEHCAGP